MKVSKRYNGVGMVLLALFLVNCSSADFDGLSSSEANQARDLETQVLPSDPVDEPIEPLEPTEPITIERAVYQIHVIDSNLSLDGADIDVVVSGDGSQNEIILVIHVLQPTRIHLKGEVNKVKAIFLSANSSLAQSEVYLESGEVYPSAQTATAFGWTYQMGSSVSEVIGEDLAMNWSPSVSVENFSNQLGENKCFYFAYDSAFNNTAEFYVRPTDSQVCYSF